MCLTIPAKILEIKGPTALVEDFNKIKKQVIISALSNLEIDDWVLLNANLAIQKISENEANEIINLLKK